MNAGLLTEPTAFFTAGINYKKTDAQIRGQYAITGVQYKNILLDAPSYHVESVFILSTCNRTEIYGFAENAETLIDLLCSQTAGSREAFVELAYVKKGMDAIAHLFHVAAGLDSQILGDYEIVGQIKQAVKFSKEHQSINSFLERLVNCVLQSSKMIKNQTSLSGGTVSASFAAIHYLKEKVNGVAGKKFLLVGIGKIGRNTCKNIVDYLGTKNITLINRSEEKAAKLAGELGLNHAPISELAAEIRSSDIILVATNSPEPTILKSHLEHNGDKIIIDLSIPFNVEMAARDLSNVQLITVDELSRMKDETLKKREAEVPKAIAIINIHIEEFMEWHGMHKQLIVLKAVKTKLNEIHTSPLFGDSSPDILVSLSDTQVKIQRVINGMATKMRSRNQQGCHYIEAINEFISTGTN